MRFDFTAEEEAFRADVCAFLQRELTPEVWREHRDANEQGFWTPDFIKAFRRKLGEVGYIGMGWPAAYGGGGRSRIYQTIFAEEMEYHRAPGLDRSITYVPSALLAFGSEEQKAAFLPRINRGELSWFVGYSEPEAGSDLANLQTQAIAEGDDFVLTGQKAFSSEAHMADYGWVAARTNGDVPKHRGISLFIVDMQSPGISITQVPTVAGWTHHAVHLDHVRVPRDKLVGEIDGGWQLIMGAIDFERAALSAPGLVTHQLDRLLDYCSEAHDAQAPLLDDPLVQDQLVELAIESEVARLMSYWVACMHAQGHSPQHETSLAVLYKRETARLADQLGMDLLDAYAPLRTDSPWARLAGEVEAENRDHLYFSFAAGGFDITRNVIARRGLGLPR
jgi:alkylation response protein AidB-like acyl-CoA dehydrogenase